MFLKVAVVYEFHSSLLFKFKPGEDITALGGSVVAPGGGSQTTHGVTVLVSTPGEETTTSFRQGGHLEQQTGSLFWFLQYRVTLLNLQHIMFLKVAVVYEFHSSLLFKFKPGEDITALGGSVVAPGGGSQTTHGVTVLVSTPGEETTTSFRQRGI